MKTAEDLRQSLIERMLVGDAPTPDDIRDIIDGVLKSVRDDGYRAGIEDAAKVCEEYSFALERNGEHLTKLVAWQAGRRVRALSPAADGER